MICLLRKASYNAVYKHTYVAVRIQQPADGEFFRQIFLEWGQNNVPFVYLIGFSFGFGPKLRRLWRLAMLSAYC